MNTASIAATAISARTSRLPNLHPRKFKFFVTGSDVEIDLDVENIGAQVAAAADAAVMVNFIDPLTGNQLPDIVSVVMVDPPTAAQPTHGPLWESDETDNGLMHSCRVYGPNPDTSLEACN